MEELKAAVKLALRIKTDKFDTEIIFLIGAALADADQTGGAYILQDEFRNAGTVGVCPPEGVIRRAEGAAFHAF